MTPALPIAIVGLAIASISDVRTGKIPNWLTGSLMAAGLVVGLLEGAGAAAVIGLAVALLVHFPLWMIGVEKAGDAKLMMAIGALLHWPIVAETTAWCAVLYLPVGLAILAAQGRLANLVAAARWTLLKAQGIDPGERPPPTMLRTAPIIAAACAAALATPWFDFG